MRDVRHILAVPLVLVAGFGIATAPASAHPGLSANLKIDISDEAVVYEVLLSADYLRQLAHARGVALPKPEFKDGEWTFASDADRSAAMTAFTALLGDAAQVRIDDLPVPGVFEPPAYSRPLVPGGYEQMLESFPPDGRCVIRFPAKGKPQTVSLIWRLYPEDPMRESYGLPPQTEVVAELDAYDESRFIVFTFDEPEHVWHAPSAPPRERIWPVLAQRKAATIAVPVLSVALIGGWLLALSVAGAIPRLRRGFRGVAIAGVAPLVVGGLAWWHFTWEVESPWGKRVELPSDDQARELLEALQRNIYRAFDYKKESDVYDVLAVSVDGPLLDDVYNEVHQSLILRDQGGAVTNVKEVHIGAIDVLSTGVQPDGRVAVQLAGTWRVVGAVAHWGHMHTRTNEYSALFTIAARDERWKITGIEVLSQKRIVNEGDDPLPPLGDTGAKPPPGPS